MTSKNKPTKSDTNSGKTEMTDVVADMPADVARVDGRQTRPKQSTNQRISPTPISMSRTNKLQQEESPDREISPSHSPDPSIHLQDQYKNIVFEGGGVLGVAHCGAVDEMWKRGMFANIKNFAGASAGAIVAAMLACGAEPDFLHETLTKADFASFAGASKLKGIYTFCREMGFNDGDEFTDWFASTIQILTGYANITLRQVYEKFGNTLYICATNLNNRECEYMCHTTHADMTVVQCVRMSMSVPGLFSPVKYNGNLYVDGGLMDNYPIKVFRTDTASASIIDPATIGLILDTDDLADPVKDEIDTLVELFQALLGCVLASSEKSGLRPQELSRTVRISCGKTPMFNFDLTLAQKQELFNKGRDAVIKHFGK